jgi:mono/diheme cytochrome c family protein
VHHRTRAIALSFVAVATAAPAAAQDMLPGQILRWQDAALVAEGEAVHEAECAVCHGANLEGQADWQVRLENGR